MKKYMLSTLAILMLLACQARAQTQGQRPDNDNHYPWVPRVSAYEAYSKYKNGQAIILHTGGAKFAERHIMGAMNIDFKPRDKYIARLPKRGIELFLYCY